MLMRKLGRTGLRVAALCLGGNTFGWTTDQKASEAVLDAYVDAGGNFIDTADVYSRWVPGNTGRRVGDRARHVDEGAREPPRRAHRHQGHGADGPGPERHGPLAPAHHGGRGGLAAPARTDYIDLYQGHWDDRETPLDETLRAFDDLVRQGKVRYIGASNYHAWRLTRALWESDRRGYVRYESLQPKYNLVFRDEYERELEPLCLEQGVGVIPYSSLGQRLSLGQVPPRRRPADHGARRRRAEGLHDRPRLRRPGGSREGGGRRRRDAGPGGAVLARPPARDHGPDRQRHLGGPAAGARWRHRAPPGRRGERGPRPRERLAVAWPPVKTGPPAHAVHHRRAGGDGARLDDGLHAEGIHRRQRDRRVGVSPHVERRHRDRTDLDPGEGAGGPIPGEGYRADRGRVKPADDRRRRPPRRPAHPVRGGFRRHAPRAMDGARRTRSGLP